MKLETLFKRNTKRFSEMFESNDKYYYERIMTHEAGHKVVDEVIHPELKYIYTIYNGMPSVTVLNTTISEEVWDSDDNFLENYATERLAGYAAEMLCYDMPFDKASTIVYNQGKLAFETNDEQSKDYDEYAAYDMFKTYKVPKKCIKVQFVDAIKRAQDILCSHKDRWIHHYERAWKYFGPKLDELFK